MINVKTQQHSTQIKHAVHEWKQTFDHSNVDIGGISPPLLLSASDTFVNSAKKVVVFGQETFGWSWTKESVAETVGYPEFSFTNLNSLSDFLANNDSVAALCWAYEKFEFAKHQPLAFRSPFWRAFRDLRRLSGCELIWTNCIKCDFQGSTILQLLPTDRDAFTNQQKDFVRNELSVLTPDAAVFFTGPNYDGFLKQIFPDLKFEPITGEKMLARLHHPSLPKVAFRTYHPAYLNRAGLWGQLKTISDAINN